VDSRRLVRCAVASILCCAGLWPTATPLADQYPTDPVSEFVDPHPAPGNQFGTHVVALSTGNVVITSPFDDAGSTDAGAVYLFNGSTGALISILRGSTPNDNVGSGGVTALANGNYVVQSPNWSAHAGAVTWGSGVTGVYGTVSVANSLVGTRYYDEVGVVAGKVGVKPLPNGNYVVLSPNWDDGVTSQAGAATWGSGVTGVTGVISAANSLIGSSPNDHIGSDGVTTLSNGNYVVASPQWAGSTGANGAATWGSGTTGVKGAVSAANSLVGWSAGDAVGSGGVTALANGNYVVSSPSWRNGGIASAGAATWGSGTTGVTGVVSAANSLVGSTAGDGIGSGSYYDSGVRALTNGNYVVRSSYWDNGAIVDAGASTWGNGITGVSGVVSAANSLVGSTANDHAGASVTPLTNGNYVVGSNEWDNGAIADAGAATWGSGTTGVSGLISATNSLVGSTAGDGVGPAVALSNGNYAVASWNWDNGGVVDAGAVTWGDGTTGVHGAISAANSLVGSTANQQVGYYSVRALPNGNYVVGSAYRHDGGVVGAVTWCDGATGLAGEVTAANSLVGSTAGDALGYSVTVLSNGNYVVDSPFWDNGGAVDAGAVTWGDGTTGVSGVISTANSLVGTQTYDYVGGWHNVTALPNGNYVAYSSNWRNSGGQGAVTWGNGTTGVKGAVTAANSLVGSNYGDGVGSRGNGNGYGVTTFSNGDYVVSSWWWDNGAGAATWGDGTTGVSGFISTANSLVGATSNADMHMIVADNVNHTFIASFLAEGGGRVLVGSPVKATTTAVDGGVPLAFALDVRPNPASGKGLRVELVLPTGADARLQLLDVSGRRVLEREVGSLGAGRHTVNLAEGRRVVPGIYWLRLVQGANQRTARVAVIE
jgi:uncharacterized protein DUF5650